MHRTTHAYKATSLTRTSLPAIAVAFIRYFLVLLHEQNGWNKKQPIAGQRYGGNETDIKIHWVCLGSLSEICDVALRPTMSSSSSSSSLPDVP